MSIWPGDAIGAASTVRNPRWIEAIRHVVAAAKRIGIRAGLHCGSAAYAAKAIGWGYDLVTLPNDVRMLASAAAANVREARVRVGRFSDDKEN